MDLKKLSKEIVTSLRKEDNTLVYGNSLELSFDGSLYVLRSKGDIMKRFKNILDFFSFASDLTDITIYKIK